VSSASVHLAEIGTTFSSGLSHWRFGNVSWPLVAKIAGPGAVGAFAGATVLSSLAVSWLEGSVAVLLLGLGVLVIYRSVKGHLRGGTQPAESLRARLLSPLGLGAGFLDAIGGGGWGPIATPTLLTVGRVEPRTVIGSVSTSEFFVTTAASAGFLVGLGGEGISASYVLALMAGGVVAAPLAAYLVRHVDPSALGVVVGTLLLVVNARTLLIEAGAPGAARLPALVALIVVGALLALRTYRERPADRPAAAEPRPAELVGDAA
jgi:uncharacterized membrane protein YfcA